jgi:lathosterol oxidase
MNFIKNLLEYLVQLSISELFFLFLFENGILIILSVTVGFILDKTIKGIFHKISTTEILWTCSTLFLNTLITLIGFLLYKYGYVIFSFETNVLWILLDTLVLIMAMDFLMYVFHYFIHNTKFIKKIHDLHHRYEEPTAVTLFVLNPLEVLGFGSLWLSLIMIYPTSVISVFIYLFLNLLMGMIGHLELEVIPVSWSKNFITKWIANTTFHNDHHKQHTYNYGFYTSLWDKLFGTEKK